MITTRNRREELRRTLMVLRTLEPRPEETLVCADGCADDTVEMLRAGFPECAVITNETPRGSVFSRDRLLRLAKGEIVISLDDDSYPVQSDFLVQTQRLFVKNTDAAVISFPELREGDAPSHPSKKVSSPPRLVSAYANCAAAMRRDVYMRSAGFPSFFGHMYEEPDYALQCYSLGFVVRFEPSLPIRHHVSQVEREPIGRHHLNARNELWSVLMRCPFPQLFAVALFRVWRQFRYACSEGLEWAVREPCWWWRALLGVAKCWRMRQPVPWSTYYSWMKLARLLSYE
jgi:GT2 family glycosyltransferase